MSLFNKHPPVPSPRVTADPSAERGPLAYAALGSLLAPFMLGQPDATPPRDIAAIVEQLDDTVDLSGVHESEADLLDALTASSESVLRQRVMLIVEDLWHGLSEFAAETSGESRDAAQDAVSVLAALRDRLNSDHDKTFEVVALIVAFLSWRRPKFQKQLGTLGIKLADITATALARLDSEGARKIAKRTRYNLQTLRESGAYLVGADAERKLVDDAIRCFAGLSTLAGRTDVESALNDIARRLRGSA